jgi:hypothetical protein
MAEQDSKVEKTYVPNLGGVANDLSGQIATLQSAFTPAVAAGMPQSPTGPQPGETISDSDGSMVTSGPSSSGTGAMVTGAGQRAAGS